MLIKINNSWIESSIVDVIVPVEDMEDSYTISVEGYDLPLVAKCSRDEIDAFAAAVNDAKETMDVSKLLDLIDFDESEDDDVRRLPFATTD